MPGIFAHLVNGAFIKPDKNAGLRPLALINSKSQEIKKPPEGGIFISWRKRRGMSFLPVSAAIGETAAVISTCCVLNCRNTPLLAGIEMGFHVSRNVSRITPHERKKPPIYPKTD